MDIGLRVLTTLFFGWGLILAWLRRREPVFGMFLFGYAGILASIPFIPPADGGIRIHAATILFAVLPVSIALTALADKLHISNIAVSAWSPPQPLPFYGYAIVFLLFTIIGSAILRNTIYVSPSQPPACALDEIPVQFRISKGAYISIAGNDSAQETHIPVVLIKDVERSMSDFAYGEFAYIPRRIKRPAFMTLTVNLLQESAAWVIGPPGLAGLPSGRIVSACGTQDEENHSVIYINRYQ
jgi:hypothetical protein